MTSISPDCTMLHRDDIITCGWRRGGLGRGGRVAAAISMAVEPCSCQAMVREGRLRHDKYATTGRSPNFTNSKDTRYPGASHPVRTVAAAKTQFSSRLGCNSISSVRARHKIRAGMSHELHRITSTHWQQCVCSLLCVFLGGGGGHLRWAPQSENGGGTRGQLEKRLPATLAGTQPLPDSFAAPAVHETVVCCDVAFAACQVMLNFHQTCNPESVMLHCDDPESIKLQHAPAMY